MKDRSRKPKRDAVVIGLFVAYIVVNFLWVQVMMEIDPTTIFHIWPMFVILGPGIFTVTTSIVWMATRRFHIITLLLIIIAMCGTAWCNFAFVAACVDAV